MNILKWAKDSVAKTRKKDTTRGKKIRKNVTDYAATKQGPIGNIARARKERDRKLKEIMED